MRSVKWSKASSSRWHAASASDRDVADRSRHIAAAGSPIGRGTIRKKTKPAGAGTTKNIRLRHQQEVLLTSVRHHGGQTLHQSMMRGRRLVNTALPDPSSTLLANLPSLLPRLEALYKDVHAHPELSMQENRTADLAANHLRDNGYEVTTGVGKTGVVGLLRNGEGPTVMLRADMDALPVREAGGVDYASTVMASDAAGNAVPVA